MILHKKLQDFRNYLENNLSYGTLFNVYVKNGSSIYFNVYFANHLDECDTLFLPNTWQSTLIKYNFYTGE